MFRGGTLWPPPRSSFLSYHIPRPTAMLNLRGRQRECLWIFVRRQITGRAGLRNLPLRRGGKKSKKPRKDTPLGYLTPAQLLNSRQRRLLRRSVSRLSGFTGSPKTQLFAVNVLL